MSAGPTSLEQPNPEIMQALRAHEFYAYDLRLRFMWSSTGRNLLPSLPRERTYIVDNNISWKKLAAAHPNLNFVLGCTVSEEAENLQGVLFSSFPTDGYANVFTLDLVPGRREIVVFHRLDRYYQKACFAGVIPPLSLDSVEHRSDQLLAADSLRLQISQSFSENRAKLQRTIAAMRPNCAADFMVAGTVAAMTTALFLQALPPATQKRKLDSRYLQLPGDTRLIAEALFFGFSILSHDERDVHTMARLAGVTVAKALELAS